LESGIHTKRLTLNKDKCAKCTSCLEPPSWSACMENVILHQSLSQYCTQTQLLTHETAS